MKNFIRILSLILALLMVVPFLFACNGDKPDESENESTPDEDQRESESKEESETKDPTKADLPDIKWDGAVFNVLGYYSANAPQFNNFEVVYDEETLGEGVNDAIFKRNTLLETRYDVKIVMSPVGDISASLAETSVSGDHLYDLAFQEIGKIGQQALEGYFFDLNQLKYIDFTKPYWSELVNDTIAIADKIYFTSSDFALRDKSRAYILVYNTAIADEHNLNEIVSIAQNGKWTMDLMTEYADIVDADITGEGTRSIYDDVYGFVSESGEGFASLIYGMDNMIIGRNEDNDLTLTMNTERIVESIDKALKLYANDNLAYQAGSSDWYASSKCWWEGRTLFSTANPHFLKGSTEKCEFDFGILPYPKLNEEQDRYYTSAPTSAMLFAIPTSCKSADFSGFMIEALSSESTDTSLYAYYEVACKTRYSYNKTNGEMLDLIFEGLRYDCGMIYSTGGLYELLKATIPNARQNLFSSLYKRKEASANNKLTEIKETLEALDY